MRTAADPPFGDFLRRLQALEGDPHAASAYATEYVEGHMGRFPIIEGNTAHFVCREKLGSVIGVGGEWNGFDARRAIMRLVGGGLLHYQHDFEPDARLDYLIFMAGVEWADRLHHDDELERGTVRAMRDPLNSRIGESGLGSRSELAMPAYRRPAITVERPDTQPGTLREGMIRSRALGRQRAYTVYLPKGYDEGKQAYPSIYFHDGGDYLTMGKAPIILDNLIHAGAIPPIVAMFVPPVERDGEYNCDDRYVRFLGDELVPEMQRRYNLVDDPGKRAIMGPSLGGLISLYIAYRRPDLFGLVGAQSSVVRCWTTKRRRKEEVFDALDAYASEPRLTLKLHMVMGTYEDCFATDGLGRCRDLLNPVRELREALERSGYEHRYIEQHQGHSWGLWRDCLADALEYLFAEGSDALEYLFAEGLS